jgi:8-oxo-dGTP pyrophosphatase MutT (NUDIX family)
VNPVVVPRPASTVMVIRGGIGTLEVLMLRRSLESDFVRGAYVFPGGAVDPGDSDPELVERCVGRSDEQASALLDLPAGGLTYWASAFRECFEEAGVLFATGSDGQALSFDDPEVEARFVEHRRALNAGERSFLEICRVENLTLPVDSVYYVGHWITPEGSSRRYDTRFFATLAPSGQTAAQDEIETIDHMWVAPSQALAQQEAGEIELVFPTIWNLRLLSEFRSPLELMRSLSNLGAVPTIQPKIVIDHEGRPQVIIPRGPDDMAEGEDQS